MIKNDINNARIIRLRTLKKRVTELKTAWLSFLWIGVLSTIGKCVLDYSNGSGEISLFNALVSGIVWSSWIWLLGGLILLLELRQKKKFTKEILELESHDCSDL